MLKPAFASKILSKIRIPGIPAPGTVEPGNAVANLTWSAPSDNGNSEITGYNIYANGVLKKTVSTPNATVAGLENGVDYTFTIVAVNAAGVSSQTNSLTTTPLTSPGVPSTPSAIPGNTTVNLLWTAPELNGGLNVVGYKVYVNGVLNQSVTETSATVTGLTNGTSYTFTVAAFNASFIGSQSTTSSATPRTVPSIPGIPNLSPRNTSVTASWTAPASNGGSTITGYNVYVNGVFNQSVTETSATITDLTNGTSYNITVAAFNVAGTGLQSIASTVVPRGAPGAPTLLSVTPGNASVSLAWTAPASNGGSDITGYNVYVNGAFNQTTPGLIADAYVTGLTNGASYNITVAAVNVAGTGLQSNSITTTPRTVPSAPTLSLVTPGNASVTLAIGVPTSNGGSPITGYNVYVNGVFNQTVTVNNATVTGLTNGTSYNFTVFAVNAVGSSITSNVASATPIQPTYNINYHVVGGGGAGVAGSYILGFVGIGGVRVNVATGGGGGGSGGYSAGTILVTKGSVVNVSYGTRNQGSYVTYNGASYVSGPGGNGSGFNPGAGGSGGTASGAPGGSGGLGVQGAGGTARYGGYGAGGRGGLGPSNTGVTTPGAGVVILEIPTAFYSGSQSGATSVTTSGSTTILTFFDATVPGGPRIGSYTA